MLHFLISVLFYLALIRLWTYCGGGISRLTALEYARDDLPSMKEATEMVRRHRHAYFFTPVIPLIVVLVCVAISSITGLVGSIPVVGPWLMVPGYLVAALLAVVLVFFIAVGVLSLGLMMPVVSMSGADAFESWSASYSYTLWGFSRLFVYRLILGIIGLIALVAAVIVANVFLEILIASVGMGVIGHNRDMVQLAQALLGSRGALVAPGAVAPSVGAYAATAVFSIIAFGVRALVLAYAASYYFTGNTIVAFLLRKHVDRIDVDEVYVADESAEQELGGQGEGDEETPEEQEPSSDDVSEQEDDAGSSDSEAPKGDEGA
jgi:hypothetical protein